MNEAEAKQFEMMPRKVPDASGELAEMREWLAEERSETQKAQHAYLILKKHFDRAGMTIKKYEVPASWRSLGWSLYLNIDEFISRKEHFAVLRDMFRELVDFCELAFGEFFACYLLEILEKHIDRDPPRSLIMPLLPAKALAQFDAMNEILDRRHEEELERMNQMGY